MWQCEVRAQAERVAKCGLSFRKPALAHQRKTQVVVPIGVGRIAGNGLSRGVFRLPCQAGQRQHPCQIHPGFREPGFQPNGSLVACGAFVEAACIAKDIAEIVVCSDAFRLQCERSASGSLGLGEAAERAKDRRMVRMQLRVFRRARAGVSAPRTG